MITIKKFSKVGCVPCTIVKGYLREIDLESLGAELIEIDINEQPAVIDEYGLSGVPVLVFERDGVEIVRLTGLKTDEEIIETIELVKGAQ